MQRSLALATILVIFFAGCTDSPQQGQSQETLEEQQRQAEEMLRTDADLLDLSCDAAADEIQFTMKNRGTTDIDASTIQLHIYDYGNGEQLTTATLNKDVFSADTVMQESTHVDTNLSGGTVYDVEIAFPDHGNFSVARRCQAT